MRTSTMMMMTMAVASFALSACLDDVPPDIRTPPVPNGSNTPPPDDPTPTVGTGPATPTAFLTQYDLSWCQVAFSCRDAYPMGEGLTFDAQYGSNAAFCAMILDGDQNIGAYQNSVDQHYMTYNRNAAAECLATFSNYSCGNFWSNPPSTACEDVFRGLIADGDPCRHDADCLNADSVCDTGTCVGSGIIEE